MTQRFKNKAVAFCNPKGGVGKTTLSSQVAVAGVMNGYYTVFYDLDKQKTSTFYFSTIDEKFRPQEIYNSLEVEPKGNPDLIIMDCPPNMDFVPPEGSLIVAPTASTALDLHAYRKVLELERKGYKVIKVINNFNIIRNDDKALIEEFAECVVITANSGIRFAMNNGKSIWNSNHPGGRKAKREFNYLLDRIRLGYAEPMNIPLVKAIDAGLDLEDFKAKQKAKIEVQNV